MLEELKVLNGDLSPKYDKYNNMYTVKINNDIKKVDFVFKEDDNLDISIYGNDNLKEGDNKIIIACSNGSKVNYIYITVIKAGIKEVINTSDFITPLEVANSMPIYTEPLIATSCFLIIVTIFLLMFGKKKKRQQ